MFVEKIGHYDNFDELKEFVLLFCAQESIDETYGGIYSVQGISKTDGPRNTASKKFGGLGTDKNEFEFTELLDIFEDTEMEEFMDYVPYELSRSRLFSLIEREYSIHRDPSKRVHLPITTNETCMFSFYDDDENLLHTEHLPADGSVYIVDTTYKHKAGNLSSTPRIHFVGSIKNPKTTL